MAKQYVIEPQTKQFLRRKQRHPRLFRCSVALTLVAFYARRHQVGRRAFATLSAGQDMVQRQVLCVTVIAAILAAIAIADVNASTLHRRLRTVAADVDVMTEPYD